MYSERDILEKISYELPKLIPQLRFEDLRTGLSGAKEKFDFTAKITTETGVEKVICGEIKALAEPRYIREAILRVKEAIQRSAIRDAYPVICSVFLSERVRQICKEYQVGYVDLAGNYYFRFNNFYLEKVIEKNPFKENRKLKSIFQPISSRILRVLLEKPKAIWKISELAKEAETSIGLCYKVAQKLEDQEFIKRDEDKRVILAIPSELLNSWRENYSFEQNKVLSFFSLEKNTSKLLLRIDSLAKKNKLNYALTLLTGANQVAPFVRTTDIYFYIQGGLEIWKNGLDLKEVEFGGNIHLIIPYDKGVFYGLQKVNKLQIASNIQLYLDLYKYPARGKEQAEFLREQKIKF